MDRTWARTRPASRLSWVRAMLVVRCIGLMLALTSLPYLFWSFGEVIDAVCKSMGGYPGYQGIWLIDVAIRDAWSWSALFNWTLTHGSTFACAFLACWLILKKPDRVERLLIKAGVWR